MAPPGQLSDLQQERLRVCKALLQQEGGAFEGSADIKSWVRYAECTTALHQLATGPDGGPRTDLSLGQQLEVRWGSLAVPALMAQWRAACSCLA